MNDRRPAKILVPEAQAAEMQRRKEARDAIGQGVIGILQMHYFPRTGNLIADAAVKELVPQLEGRASMEFPELVAVVHEWFSARAAAVVAEGLSLPVEPTS